MKYLDILFDRAESGFLAVWHKSNKSTRWFHVSYLDEAEDYMLEAAKTNDVYFGWGLQSSELACTRFR